MHLRRQLARFESSRRIDSARERVPDPGLEAAAGDAAELLGAITRGETRLFRVGFYITVHAGSPESLDVEVGRIQALCGSMLLDARPLTFRAFEGWITTLPLAIDAIRLRRTFDTRALAAAFPFASSEVESSGGILHGRNASTGGLVFCDRFSLENHNQVVLARSGAGKSYFSKLQILRSLYRGIEVLVVDPESEYERLAEAVGGAVVRLGAHGGHLNPLDLAAGGTPGALLEQALFVHTLVSSVVGELSAHDKAALDRAILGAYGQAGISDDTRTHRRPAPLLRDVVASLETEGASDLALRLQPCINGSHAELLDRETSVRPEGYLVVFSLRDLAEELKTPGTLIALETIWRRVSRGEPRPRVVVVDEAWWLLGAGQNTGARFLRRLAKSARKHWCGLTTITQDVADVLSSELGQAVVTNASSQILLGQSPQAIDALAHAFNLSEGEASYLLTCDRGQGLFCLGSERAPLRIVASEFEHSLCTSNPSEVAGPGEATA